jgi:hypothetical protein
MKIDELAAAIGLGRVRITDRADEELHAHALTRGLAAPAGTSREHPSEQHFPSPAWPPAFRRPDRDDLGVEPATGWAG